MGVPTADAAAGDAAVGTMIGPWGGRVDGDGIELHVPAGALSSPQNITIDVALGVSFDQVDALSPVYEFGPEGLAFDVPVTVILTVAVPLPPDTAVFWTQPGSSEYGVLQATVHTAADLTSTVQFQVSHFSRGFFGALGGAFLTGLAAVACRLPPAMGMAGEPCCAGRCFGPSFAGAALRCDVDEESITGDRCNETDECGSDGLLCCGGRSDPCPYSTEAQPLTCRDDICCELDQCSLGETACIDYEGRGIIQHVECVEQGSYCGRILQWQPGGCSGSDCCP